MMWGVLSGVRPGQCIPAHCGESRAPQVLQCESAVDLDLHIALVPGPWPTTRPEQSGSDRRLPVRSVGAGRCQTPSSAKDEFSGNLANEQPSNFSRKPDQNDGVKTSIHSIISQEEGLPQTDFQGPAKDA